MIKKNQKQYIVNRNIICMKLKKILKKNISQSIIQNYYIQNYYRVIWHIKYITTLTEKTTIQDICLKSGIYKRSNKKFNISRYELHNLCRSNLLNNFNVNSW